MKIAYTIEAGMAHSAYQGTIEIHDEELEDMDSAERDEYIETLVSEAVQDRISWDWKVSDS